MGHSRDTFYRFQKLYEEGGGLALKEVSRSKPLLKNRIEKEIEDAVVAYAVGQPAHGQRRASNELLQRGATAAPSTVRSVWLRHDLETFQKRLGALEAKVARDGLLLTDHQVAALERKKEERESRGGIGTHHPGYLGAPGHLLRGLYKRCRGKSTDRHPSIPMAGLRMPRSMTARTRWWLPACPTTKCSRFMGEQGIDLLRILADRGTEYCGAREQREYQLCLNIEDIDHTRTKAESPQANGICERFHRTMQDGFYAIAFRKKPYGSLEDMQADIGRWLQLYNNQRPHSGRYCFGKTPMQTFGDAKPLAKQKDVEQPFRAKHHL